jgi:hypothetical protein
MHTFCYYFFIFGYLIFIFIIILKHIIRIVTWKFKILRDIFRTIIHIKVILIFNFSIKSIFQAHKHFKCLITQTISIIG